MSYKPARIDLAARLAPHTPARTVPPVPARRVPTFSPRGVGAAAAGRRVPSRALSRRRAPDPLRWLGRLTRECWPAVAALAFVVLMAGASVSIALQPVTR